MLLAKHMGCEGRAMGLVGGRRWLFKLKNKNILKKFEVAIDSVFWSTKVGGSD